MSTVLSSAKDAVKYLSKLAAKHPDGILLSGPAASGKTTLGNHFRSHGNVVTNMDAFGKVVGNEWHIPWDQIPMKWDLMEGVADNISDYPEVHNVSRQALVVIQPNPEMWTQSMAARAVHEEHQWTEEFARIGRMSASAARKIIRAQIQELRSQLPQFGDRVYAITLSEWKKERTSTGRAKH